MITSYPVEGHGQKILVAGHLQNCQKWFFVDKSQFSLYLFIKFQYQVDFIYIKAWYYQKLWYFLVKESYEEMQQNRDISSKTPHQSELIGIIKK